MNPAPTTLWCLADESEIAYRRWQQAAPDWLRLRVLDGSRAGAGALANFDALIDILLSELVPQQQGRYALFGHGVGGLIAHRLAHELQSRQRPLPSDLFISACAAPSCRVRRCFALAEEDESLVAVLRRKASAPHRLLLQTTCDELCGSQRNVCSIAKRCAGPLRVPVHVFAGRKDGIDVDLLEAWVRETSSSFALDWYDGGYFYMREHHAAVFEAMLRDLSPGFRDPAMV